MSLRQNLAHLPKRYQGYGKRAKASAGHGLAHKRRYQPRVEALEDRTVPSTVILNGGGSGYPGDANGGGPPDVCGAAGPSSYIEVTNNNIQIFTPKATGKMVLTDAMGIGDFFYNPAKGNLTAIGGGTNDSTMIFDNLMGGTGRFIVEDLDVNTGTNSSQIVLAVSTTNNPTDLNNAASGGSWNFYAITTTQTVGGTTNWTDYPGNPGFNADAVVFTFNPAHSTMANPNGSLTGETEVLSINASDLANGVSQASLRTFQNFSGAGGLPAGTNSYRPVTMHDAAPGDPMWLIRNPGDGANIQVVKMTNVLSTTGAAMNPTTFVVTPLSLPVSKKFVVNGINNPLNPDSTQMSDVDTRILKAGEYKNTIAATHKIAVGTASVVSASVALDGMGNPIGGTGYTVGDTLTVNGGTGTKATLTVQTLGASGSVATVTVANPGSYSDLGGIDGTVSGGSGGGAKFNIFFRGQLDVQWYAIDVSGTPAFQMVGGADNIGRIDFGPNTYCFDPAIDINSAGQIGLGFMESDTVLGAADPSTGGFTSTFVAARNATDPAGMMQSIPLVPAGKGKGDFTGRVGDFSGMNVDPVDGTFWHVNEFGTGGPGTTDIANFAPALSLGSTDENITIRVNPLDSTMCQVLVTGTSTVVTTFANNSTMLFAVQGDANNNEVTIDETFGVVNTPILFDGGGSPGAPGDRMIVLGSSGDDTLNLKPSGATSADMTFDGSRTYSFRNIQQFNFNGEAGNDTMIVDSSASLLALANGIQYDGGGGFDNLQLVQGGGTTQFTDVYSPGPNPGQGTDVITGPGGTQTVFFQNLAPVLDTVPATTLTVNGTPANNAINYQVGSVASNGLVSIDNFEPIEFSNKTNLAINSGAGVDTLSINNPNTPTGLTGVSVTGGDPTSFDTLIVNGVASTTSVSTATSTITGATGTGGAVPITYNTFESLIVNASPSTTLAISGSSSYVDNPATAADAGTIQTNTLPISFTGIGSGKTLALTGAGGSASLVVNGTPANDAFTVAATTGNVAFSGRATIAPTSISSLTINGLGGNDAFSVTGPQPYTSITLAADPSASSVANVTGDGTAVVAHLGGATASVTGGGLGNVSLPGIEVLNLNAGAGNITLAGTASPDAFTVTPTGANTATAQVGTLAPVVNTTNTGILTVDADGGSDTLTVNGTSAGDTINVSGVAVTVVGLHTVNFVNVESLGVNGLAGSDTFNVTSSATLPISIDGGDPVGVLPGDVLNVLTSPGDTVNLFPGPTTDSGGVVVNSNQPISYIHIESLTVTGGGSPVINGTNGNDVITIIARDSSYAPGLDGIQDFTVSVNAGPNILFINTPSLTVHALAGDDQIVVQAPAPNLAAWNVALTLDGGPSSALGDQLVVSTPGPNQATYTPGSANSGTLGVTNASGNVTNVTITDIENFVYDGQAGGDSLKMVGSSAANVFTLTPGATNDAGTLSMDSTLPVSFQNLGAGGQVVVDGNGGADVLNYNGTPGNDTFVVNSSVLGGQVNLNARVPLLTANISNVFLNGLGGDDTFTLVPTILSSPYLLLHLVGGPPASATGSQANLTATAGTPIALSGQTITQGGVSVIGSGLQNENLNGAGDDLTYNSVVGVTENINVIASPTANQGQVSVPGVALWSFTNVPIVYVNGTPADNDTVTFTGTNNSDVYQINLAAAGMDADPVLKLQTTTGSTLLTLANYTGFQTLNIAGLDGADVFNVTVAPTGPGRQIFINGDLPSGKKKLTDVLNVFYVNKPHPKIIHSTSTQDPDAGLVSVSYGTGLPSFLLQFDGIENVTIHQL